MASGKTDVLSAQETGGATHQLPVHHHSDVGETLPFWRFEIPSFYAWLLFSNTHLITNHPVKLMVACALS